MTRQIDSEFEVETCNDFKRRGAYADSAVGPSAFHSPAFSEAPVDLLESDAEGIRCIRGCLIALCMEVTAALCIYGVWRVWHLFR